MVTTTTTTNCTLGFRVKGQGSRVNTNGGLCRASCVVQGFSTLIRRKEDYEVVVQYLVCTEYGVTL